MRHGGGNEIGDLYVKRAVFIVVNSCVVSNRERRCAYEDSIGPSGYRGAGDLLESPGGSLFKRTAASSDALLQGWGENIGTHFEIIRERKA